MKTSSRRRVAVEARATKAELSQSVTTASACRLVRRPRPRYSPAHDERRHLAVPAARTLARSRDEHRAVHWRGGLALAMHEAGFRHLLAVEMDKRACATLRANGAEPFDPDAGQAADWTDGR